MKNHAGKKGNKKARLYLYQILQNEHFQKRRDGIKKLKGEHQALAIYQLARDYRLTDFMLNEIFRNIPTLGSDPNLINVCKIDNNVNGSFGFPVKIEISSLASREDVLDFIRGNWPKIKNILQDKRAVPRVRTPKRTVDSEIDLLIHMMKKQGDNAKKIRKQIIEDYDTKLAAHEITARYNNEVKRRRAKIKGSG